MFVFWVGVLPGWAGFTDIQVGSVIMLILPLGLVCDGLGWVG